MSLDLLEIVSAWITAANPSEAEASLAQKRSEICNSCEHKKERIKKFKLGIVCDLCGCPLMKKIYSKNNNPCPIGKWEEVDKLFFTKKLNNQKII